ncbi:trypsin-like peptidase domain-containing protein [Candidatus Uhrbacteria bacterium]|nr:trypsin-like peptidase domain-containing protein [Candidatus Uhrbacteria bacterium]
MPFVRRAATSAKEQTQPQTEEQTIIRAVKKASPAVVSIVIAKDVPVMERYYVDPFGGDDFFQQFFGGSGMQMPQYRQKGTEKKEVGAGSGFLVSADGYIVTNRHVVEDEGAEYTAIFQNGAKHAAKVLARDAANDIAILKIEGQNFPVMPLGDSDKIEVGQKVLAIGYALGRFSNSVSSGIVSGLQRSITAGSSSGAEDLYDVIQTDTAINPGNSGGPLLNLEGKAIGVNVAIVQGSQNIGFSLPINDVKRVVDSVRKTGKISRPFLGVRYVLVNEELRKANQLSVDYGALVSRGQQPADLAVMPGSPADKAGIVENDIILQVDGKKISAENPLAVALGKHSAGDKVKLMILHQGGIKLVEVALEERK